MEKRIAVFVDTNVAQVFVEKSVFLSRVGVPSEYYALVQFITENQLEAHIEICFPDVVVREMKKHMISCFHESLTEIEKQAAHFRKVFGDLLKIDYQVDIPHGDYHAYVQALFQEFFENPRNLCKPIPCPQDTGLIDTLLDKAIHGIKPFQIGGMNGKKYKDAGFKDSLIAETIYRYCEEHDRIGVLISNDGDYGDRFSSSIKPDSQFVIYKSFEAAIKALGQYFKTDPIKRIFEQFGNAYWHSRILAEAEVELDEAVSERTVEEVSLLEDKSYLIKMKFIVNEAEYLFRIRFDSVANDIIEVSYEIQND